MAQTEQRAPARRSGRRWRFLAVLTTALTLLFGLPWWTLVLSPDWPTPVTLAATAVFAASVGAFVWLMYLGHRSAARDWAARISDPMLGVVWVLFAWTVLSIPLRLALLGVDDPARSRIIAALVIAVALVLVPWGVTEAMRVPRVKHVEVIIPRLNPDLDGTTVVVLADTHFGPINRARWSARLAAKINELEPDIVCHAGDIADGSVAKRREQAAPLGDVKARLAKVFVTGNHEYFGEAQAWLDHLTELGWEPLHNRHIVVRDGLVIAGIDDPTGSASGLAGHGENLTQALDGAPDLPVLLVAHQPRQVIKSAEAGVDLQVSGHTHGGQIWPFHLLVRIDQPSVHGLTWHGERTQLYTTRGAGFWGPPLRIFAPSEITSLTLRAS
jgi:predicted MPP superfamily phosphohydrolase